MTKKLVARANVLVFAVLIAILLIVIGVTWSSFVTARAARDSLLHSYEVLGAIKELDLAVTEAETGQRGYLLTGKQDYLSPYEAALGNVTFLQGDLQRLTSDNPSQQDRLRALGDLIQRKLEELAQTIQLRRSGDLAAATAIVNTDAGRDFTKEIEAVLTAITADEQALLASRLADSSRQGVWVRSLVGLGTLFAVLALLWAARLLDQAWSRSYALEAEQRALAARLHTSLESLSQGVGVFSPDRRLTDWNDCFRVLLDVPATLLRPGTGYAAIADPSSHGAATILEREDQIRHGSHVAGQPVVYERERHDGHQLEVRRTAMPDGGFVLTVTDMTKRARAEGVLREAQKMQAIGQLTGGIAHDFNNLLTVILGNLEIVRTKIAGDDTIQSRIERATWAAQRGAALTGQLLAFARKQPLTPIPLDLSALIPELVPLLRRTLGEHIEVRYVEAAGLWPAMADAAQLESAVLNLALNARDAMPNGGRLTIEIANKILDEDYARTHAEVIAGDYTMLAVSDTGHGMTADVIARAFEPFFTTKVDGRGTGLGLAMVFGFIKQSGGHAKIYSEQGHGTTVRLYLPRAIGASPAIQRSSRPVELPRGYGTILVIEDEPAVREIASAILADLGYRTLEAADGEEALRVFGAHAGDVRLVLTDVVLPGKIRGRDVAAGIKAIRPEVKVLFMSGYTENSIVHHGRLDDGVELIGKPFNREQLAGKVAELLGRSDAPQNEYEPGASNVVSIKGECE